MAKKKKLTANKILKSNKYVYLTSREIAENTGKLHQNVMRAIRKLRATLVLSENDFIAKTKYVSDETGRRYDMYVLSPKVAFALLCHYSPQWAYDFSSKEEIDAALGNVDKLKPRFRYEEMIVDVISQITGQQLIPQFPVLNYRIDAYDAENNVAYEVDEAHHRNQQKEDVERQKIIERELGCTFVRIDISKWA